MFCLVTVRSLEESRDVLHKLSENKPLMIASVKIELLFPLLKILFFQNFYVENFLKKARNFHGKVLIFCSCHNNK